LNCNVLIFGNGMNSTQCLSMAAVGGYYVLVVWMWGVYVGWK